MTEPALSGDEDTAAQGERALDRLQQGQHGLAQTPRSDRLARQASAVELREGQDRQRRVLYIEDDEVNALLAQAMIQTQAGWHLDVERTGIEGLARLRAQLPDVLLLDLQLPDMTGFQIHEQLRSDPALAALPCILLTADATEATQQQALRHGFFCVHHKPLQVLALLADLERACASRTGA